MSLRIAIKIGSNVLADPQGGIDIPRMSALVSQISTLHKQGIEVILISSGAVASGRSVLKSEQKLDAVSARQLYSAIGQTKLINRYYKLFIEHDILCGQILTTKESLSTRRHYLNQKNCIEVMLAHGVIPIVNENDTISVTELMFTDNDELSGLMATMMHCRQLIILSNIDGIFNGNPSDPSARVIPLIENGKQDLSEYIHSSKSSFGRGGMITKCNIARKVADEGIEVIIANGKRDNILIDLLQHPEETLCTRFAPAPHVVSGVKKWIAHSDGFAKGALHINDGAQQALLSSKATSLLPIGVTAVEGDFEKDDIVRVIGPTGQPIGVGRVRYNSEKTQSVIGTHGARPVIHYDYLYLETL